MGDLTHISTFIYAMLTLIASICVLASVCTYIGSVYQQYLWNREDMRVHIQQRAAYLAVQQQDAPLTPTTRTYSSLTDLSNTYDLLNDDYHTYTEDMKEIALHEYTMWVDSMEARHL